jgi:hypothetical protein
MLLRSEGAHDDPVICSESSVPTCRNSDSPAKVNAVGHLGSVL